MEIIPAVRMSFPGTLAERFETGVSSSVAMIESDPFMSSLWHSLRLVDPSSSV